MFFLKDLPTNRMIEGYVTQTGTGDVDSIARALTMLRSASILDRQLETYFNSQGLSQLKFHILIVIDREPDRTSLRQSEINQRLDVSKPVLHRTTTALTKDGYLRSLNDPDDSRAHLLELTDVGRIKLEGLLPAYFQLIAGFMQGEN